MMNQCKKCLHEFVSSTCWNCGQEVIDNEKVFAENKKFFGIQEKEELEKIKNNWSKTGDILRKKYAK